MCYSISQNFTCAHTHTHKQTHTHTRTQDGSTALYFAACNGCEEVVGLLLEANANPDWKYTVTALL